MPQEFHVLRCVECQTFQVHIVKKVSKWACKMCGKKQSVLQVFARGTGKECRLHVQELNKKRIQQAFQIPLDNTEDNTEDNIENKPDCNAVQERGESKWAKYLDNSPARESEEEGEAEVGGWDLEISKKRKCVTEERNSKRSVSSRAVGGNVESNECLSGFARGGNNGKEASASRAAQVVVTPVASKWAKYVEPAQADNKHDSSASLEAGDEVGEIGDSEGYDLDELLKF